MNLPESEGVRLLSFDGGDLRAVSQLIILDEFMRRVEWDRKSTDRILPCEYFHMMAGVGTGGIIAILLVILRMGIEETIEEFISIWQTVYADDPLDQATRSVKLEEVIKSLLKRKEIPENRRMYAENADEPPCKVFVCAISESNPGICEKFRNYKSGETSTNPTIVEAIRATCTIPKFFSPIGIESVGSRVSYVTGAHNFNNPSWEMIKEACGHFGKYRSVGFVVSLGAGQRALLRVPTTNDVMDSSDSTAEMAFDCDQVAWDLEWQLAESNVYHRLCVDRSLEYSGNLLNNRVGDIKARTDGYLEQPDVMNKVDRCIASSQRLGEVILEQIAATQPQPIAESPEQMHNVFVQEIEIKSVIEYQHIWVEFSTSTGQSPPNKRISIAQNSTYRHAQNDVNENGQNQWVLLQPHYGPEPYWTAAHLDSPIPAACQTLHAVNTDGGTYSIAVVRDAESDYPLVIDSQGIEKPAKRMSIIRGATSSITSVSHSLFNRFNVPDGKDPPHVTAESRSPNFYTAVATADPSLQKRIGSINTSYSIGTPDVQARPYSLYQDMKNRGENPQFIVNLDGSKRNAQLVGNIILAQPFAPIGPAKFQLAPLSNLTPSFLQILVLNCKELLQRSYNLQFFSLELIHVLSALLHVVNHLGEWLSSRKDKDGLRTRDDLQFGLLLAESLEKCFEELNRIVEDGENNWFDPDEIPQTTTQILDKLCGEYPGAVAIRDSYARFDELKRIDATEAQKSNLVATTHLKDVTRLLRPPVDTRTEVVGSVTLDEAIARLRSPSSNSRRAAISTVLSIARHDSTKIVESTAISEIIALLRHSDWNIQRDAIKAISTLASYENTRAQIANSRALSELTRSLTYSNPYVRSDATNAISILVGHNDLRARIVESNAVTTVIALMQDENHEVRLAAIEAILSLASHDDVRAKIANPPVFYGIVALLKDSKLRDVVTPAILALAEYYDIRTGIIESNALSEIIALLRYPGSDTRRAAISTVCALASYDDTRAKFVTPTVLSELTESLQSSDPYLRRDVIDAIKVLVSHDDVQANIADSKAVAEIIALMKDTDSDVYKPAKLAVLTFSNYENIRIKMVEPPAFPEIMALLQQEDSEQVRRDGFDVILTLAVNADIRTKMIESTVLSEIIALVRHRNWEVRIDAFNAILTLAGHDDIRTKIVESTALSEIIALLKDLNPDVRRTLVGAIPTLTSYENVRAKFIDSTALTEVIALLEEDAAGLRASAIDAVVYLASYADIRATIVKSRVVAKIVALMKDKNFHVHLAAMKAVSTLSNYQNIRVQMVESPALAEIIGLMKDENPYGRKIAVSVIPKLVDDSFDFRSITEVLMEPTPDVTLSSLMLILALTRHEPLRTLLVSDYLPRLASILNYDMEQMWEARFEVISALCEYPDVEGMIRGSEVIAVLFQWLKSGNESKMASAAQLLTKIGLYENSAP